MIYDQSFNYDTVSRLFRMGDARKFPSIKFDPNKKIEAEKAIKFAHSGIGTVNPLKFFKQKKRTVFQAEALAHQLVLRKLSENLRRISGVPTQNRESIVANLIHMLSEGVPYRIYRLDISSFYESFNKNQVLECLNSLSGLSALTKNNIEILFQHHKSMGGEGIPRGLALSALLSDLMMKNFDRALITHPLIYFSARYVDDIVLITNPAVPERQIFSYLKSPNFLPTGLNFNLKKTRIGCFTKCVQPIKVGSILPTSTVRFDYLGYEFFIEEPLSTSKINKNKQHRKVSVDIANTKITRIKTRLTKSFLAFAKDKDFLLLSRRLRFLTANFSVRDARTGQPNLAGIFYSYPLLTEKEKLINLDKYLRMSILSKTGPIYSKYAPFLSSMQKRKLLTNSFVSGHDNKTFMHFNGSEIGEIQECWKYE